MGSSHTRSLVQTTPFPLAPWQPWYCKKQRIVTQVFTAVPTQVHKFAIHAPDCGAFWGCIASCSTLRFDEVDNWQEVVCGTQLHTEMVASI